MSRSAEWLYAGLAFTFGLLYVFATPPFRVPDEVGHFWRACAIAEGEMAPRDGAYLPRGYERFVAATWMHPENARLASHIEIDRGHRSFLHFPTLYTPLPYVPQAVACFIGRLFSLRPAVTFYLGRILNLMSSVALIAIAIRVTSFAKWAFVAGALLPMTLFLDGSLSPDGLTIALAFLLIALLLREKSCEPVVAFLLALCKPPYFLIAVVKPKAPVLAATLAGVIVSAIFATHGAVNLPPNTDPHRQVAYALNHPLIVARAMLTDLFKHAPRYAQEMIGRLGLLDIPLPLIALIGAAVALMISWIYADATISVLIRGKAVAAIAVMMLLISLSQYLLWTPVGASTVEGIQGRYFLPLLPLFGMASGARRPMPWWLAAAIVVALAGANIAAILRL